MFRLTLAAALLTGTAALAQQGTLTVAVQLEPPHLDPTSAAAGAIDQVLYSNVFEGLTRFTETGAVVPGLAEAWDISADGLTYTFSLRDGVTFHDGTTMDADDVKFSLDRILSEDSQNAQKALYAGIAKVAVVDPLTVQVTLSDPNGSLLFNLAWGDAVIVAPESIETIKQTPIGTHFAPHNPDYVDLTGLSPHDPERAKALLAEAGYPDGFTTTLKLPPPSYARRGGEIIAAQLRAVGIQTEITNLEWAQWLEEVFRGKNYGLTIVSHTEPFDIGIYARPDYYFQYDNPGFQDLIATLNVTADPAERTALVGQAQEIIAKDYVNGYLFQLGLATVADARVQGIWPNAPVQAVDLTAVRWAQ